VTLDTTGNVKSLTIANNDATLAIGTQTLNIDIANTASSSISVTNGHVTIAGGKIVGSAGFPDQAD
jgi:hypothetical protein